MNVLLKKSKSNLISYAILSSLLLGSSPSYSMEFDQEMSRNATAVCHACCDKPEQIVTAASTCCLVSSFVASYLANWLYAKTEPCRTSCERRTANCLKNCGSKLKSCCKKTDIRGMAAAPSMNRDEADAEMSNGPLSAAAAPSATAAIVAAAADAAK